MSLNDGEVIQIYTPDEEALQKTKKTFAMRLAFLRKEKGVGQDELAELLGINQAQISKMENAKILPKWSNLIKIRDFFDCSFDFLLSDANFPAEKKYFDAIAKMSARDIEIPDEKAEKIIRIIEAVVSDMLKNPCDTNR